ncbi:hypothetical protein Tco_0767971 [Tanacetum coccineum]
MATLEFYDKHNMVAYLEKPEGTTASTNVNGEVELTASIDGQAKTITEASLRRHLKLEDNGGITSLPNTEIFEQLALMGYATDSDKLTFQKGEPAPMPHESPLQSVQSLGRDEGSLVKRVRKSEKQVKTGKARRRTKIVLSEDEAVEEDSSKQGKSLIEELDMDADISLVPPYECKYFRMIVMILRKVREEGKIQLKQSILKMNMFKRSPEKPSRTKKGLSHEEAIILQEQEIFFCWENEEEIKRIAKRYIDWNILSVIRYHALNIEPQILGIQVHSLVPMDSKEEVSKTKKSSQDVEAKLAKRQRTKKNKCERAEGGLNLKELLSLCTNLSNRVLALETAKDAQATKILKLKTRIKKLEKKCKPSISHHKAWLKSVKRLSMKKRLGKKEPISKQGRKNVKPGPSLDAFDDLDANLAHGLDYMDTKEAVNEGRQRVSTAVNISTASRPEVSTATPMTPTTTTNVFEDEDIFLADALVMLSDKAKLRGVEIKEKNEAERPARSVLTLKPLPKIDPKDKGKRVLEEEPGPVKVKSKDQGEAQIERDAEIALKVHSKAD